MPPYPVICYAAKCQQAAVFKIASHWSDGITAELKTYYLACPACLTKLYQVAMVKREACRQVPGETLDLPGIYEMHRGERDKTLRRRPDLEESSGQLKLQSFD